jgi:hypothetical protein
VAPQPKMRNPVCLDKIADFATILGVAIEKHDDAVSATAKDAVCGAFGTAGTRPRSLVYFCNSQGLLPRSCAASVASWDTIGESM